MTFDALLYGVMLKINAKVKESRLTAIVTRADGTIEDLGTIAYYHANPLRRWLWCIRQFVKRRKA